MNTAEAILLAAAAYGGIGALFVTAFVVLGVARVDHAARGAPWSFRMLIWPGAAALWPLLLAKWMRTTQSALPEPTS